MNELDTDQLHEIDRLARRWKEEVYRYPTYEGLKQFRSWAFGAGMVLSAIGAYNAAEIMDELHAELDDEMYRYLTGGESVLNL